jgi:hypothetical protein
MASSFFVASLSILHSRTAGSELWKVVVLNRPPLSDRRATIM